MVEAAAGRSELEEATSIAGNDVEGAAVWTSGVEEIEAAGACVEDDEGTDGLSAGGRLDDVVGAEGTSTEEVVET